MATPSFQQLRPEFVDSSLTRLYLLHPTFNLPENSANSTKINSNSYFLISSTAIALAPATIPSHLNR